LRDLLGHQPLEHADRLIEVAQRVVGRRRVRCCRRRFRWRPVYNCRDLRVLGGCGLGLSTAVVIAFVTGVGIVVISRCKFFADFLRAVLIDALASLGLHQNLHFLLFAIVALSEPVEHGRCHVGEICNGCKFALARDIPGGMAIVDRRAVTHIEIFGEPRHPLAMFVRKQLTASEQQLAFLDDTGRVAAKHRAQPCCDPI
jgi:hypothetical protein